jgi:putative endonuclease
MKCYYVYILASKENGTLYIGVTNNLERRIKEHKTKRAKGFTSRYDVNTLVYYETTADIVTAIQREKQIKKWKRAWKLKLINSTNPYWTDITLR